MEGGRGVRADLLYTFLSPSTGLCFNAMLGGGTHIPRLSPSTPNQHARLQRRPERLCRRAIPSAQWVSVDQSRHCYISFPTWRRCCQPPYSRSDKPFSMTFSFGFGEEDAADGASNGRAEGASSAATPQAPAKQHELQDLVGKAAVF